MAIIPTRDVTQVPRPSALARPLGASSGAAAGLTGRDFLRILRKRWLMITLSVTIATAVAAVTTMLWLMYAPFYTADALLEIVPPQGTTLQETTRLYSTDIMEQLTASQARLVKSDAVLRAALSKDSVRNTEWYRRHQEGSLQRLIDDLSVASVPNTSFIRIAMTGRNKIDLPEIVTAVAEAFEEESKNTVASGRKKSIDQLTNERDVLQRDLDAVRSEMRRQQQDIDIPNLQEKRSVLGYRIQKAISDLTQLNLARVQAEAALEIIQQAVQADTAEAIPEVMQALDLDPTLRTLQNTEVNVLTERDNLLQKFGPMHRNLQAMEARLESIRQQVAACKKELIRKAVELLESRSLAMVASIREQGVEATREYQETTAAMKDLQVAVTLLDQAALKETTLNERIKRIEDRLMDLRLLYDIEQSVVLRRRATEQDKPSMPKWGIMLPVGVLLGLVIGLGMAMLLELMDTSVKGPGDITRRTELPMLGMAPHTEDLEEQIADVRLAFMSNPDSLIGEAYRQIRTCLQFSGTAEQTRSLLVSSALPADGRTAVALNLGASYAQSGRRTLVIDANFRQPAMRKLLPQCPEGGLSSALVGRADWREVACNIEPNLDVMASGPLPPNPAELLGSEQMRKFIEQTTAEYDQVIFDGSPALVVTDAAILSTLVSGVILVVRAGVNTYGIVQRARDVFQRVGARLVGVVLNGVRVTAGGYLRKNYETYYEYHEARRSQAPEPAALPER